MGLYYLVCCTKLNTIEILHGNPEPVSKFFFLFPLLFFLLAASSLNHHHFIGLSVPFLPAGATARPYLCLLS